MVTNQRQRLARQAQRRGQTLTDNLVTSALHQRYMTAAARVLQFWEETHGASSSWDDFDVATSAWLEHIFADGLPKGYGSDALAALQHFIPEISGKLRNSWRLLKAWTRIEPPLRVLPVDPLMIGAMAGLCVQAGWPRPAALLLVGFDAFLRPGELYKLTPQDITWASSKACLSLRDTKSGIRKGAEEMVFIQSRLATQFLRRVVKSLSANEPILDRTPKQFRDLFFNMLDFLEIQGHISLYSLRRGGGTHHFMFTQSMESTLLRGRWQSTSTARIYLQDSAASLAHYQLSPAQKQQFLRLAQRANGFAS